MLGRLGEAEEGSSLTTLIAIDPGPVESAYVWLDEQGLPLEKGILPNKQLEACLKNMAIAGHPKHLYIEMVESYGMAVGRSVFETVYWSGRFAAVWDLSSAGKTKRIGRKDVKMHLCGHTKAKDANVRQALIDRYGGVEGKAKAIGRKASPGPLYGVSKDVWAALALGVTALDGVQAGLELENHERVF